MYKLDCRSGLEQGGKGFDLIIRQKSCPSLPAANPRCSGVFGSPTLVLQNPGLPGQYRCEYVLRPAARVPQTSLCLAQFQFQQFNIQSSEGCAGDRLQVGDQDVLCGTLGGSRTYQFLGELHVNFFSGGAGTSGAFRIIVTQLGCTPLNLAPNPHPVPTPPTIFPPVPTPPTIFPPVPTPPTIFPPVPTPPTIFPTLPQCCSGVYQGQLMLVASPGFPFDNGNEQTDCTYEIRPYSGSACRLKIMFKLFWVGQEGCGEVDGRRYCGCKTGTVIRSGFLPGRNKYLRYRRGRNAGGFLLEIFQESCADWSRSDTGARDSEGIPLTEPTLSRNVTNLTKHKDEREYLSTVPEIVEENSIANNRDQRSVLLRNLAQGGLEFLEEMS